MTVIVSNDIDKGATAVVSKEAAKAAPVKFGFGSIGMPTPALAKNIFRVILYMASAVNIVIIAIPQIPDHAKVQIMTISSTAVVLVHSFSKLFGIDLTDVLPPEVTTTKK